MKVTPSIISFLFVVLIFASVLGCQTNLTLKRMQAKNPLAKNSVKTPTKMVDVWNTYAQTTPEGKIVRGIAGRIHFYNDYKKKQSVKVDGDLTVFIFDGNEKNPAHAKPLKVYQFRSETLNKHYAFKKPLGHGYDFFLPFDEIGGEEKNLCVMTRFDDRLEKALVLSQPVTTVLKGTKRELPAAENAVQEFLANNSVLMKTNRELAEQASPSNIKQVGFEHEQSEKRSEKQAEKPSEEKTERPISTIILNDSMTRRLAQNAPSIGIETVTVEPSPSEPVISKPLPRSSLPTTSPQTDSRHQFNKTEITFPDKVF
ncbi:MAG: hypothetical protein LBG58_12270 [Planctomycetaceae bacterium]|jgi:hypothetical protein|nr:hypothetical protein [Planctomycetaceae bacterium]